MTKEQKDRRLLSLDAIFMDEEPERPHEEEEDLPTDTTPNVELSAEEAKDPFAVPRDETPSPMTETKETVSAEEETETLDLPVVNEEKPAETETVWLDLHEENVEESVEEETEKLDLPSINEEKSAETELANEPVDYTEPFEERGKRKVRNLRRFIKSHVSDETREKLEQTERASRSAREVEALNREAPIPDRLFVDNSQEDDTEDLTVVLPRVTEETVDNEETRAFAPITVPKAHPDTKGDKTSPLETTKRPAKASFFAQKNDDLAHDEKTVLTPAYPDDDVEEKQTEPKGIRGIFFNWILPITVALLIAVVIRFYVGGATTVSGSSMEPTLHDGDFLLVSKIPTYLKNYKRGDILIIDSPDLDEFYVKRLIGLPGETVEIQEGKVYINGKWMKEFYTDQETVSYASAKWTLGENEYFVLGDNRGTGASNDSRLFGPVLAEHIKAVSRLRIWPLTKMMLMY